MPCITDTVDSVNVLWSVDDGGDVAEKVPRDEEEPDEEESNDGSSDERVDILVNNAVTTGK